MAQHLTEQQIDSYIRRRLPAAEVLSLTDHLAECEECRRPIQRALGGDMAFAALHSAVLIEANDALVLHPTSESMSAFVDGTLSGEELHALNDHVTQCDQCSMAADDLRGFRNDVAPTLDHRHRPAIDERPGHQPMWLRWAPAFVVALLVGAGWFFWPRPETNTIQPPVVARVKPAPPSGLIDERLPAVYQRMVKRALTRQRLETSPLLAGLNRPSSALMSGSTQKESFSVVEPAGAILKSDKPAFRWSALAGGATYFVEVYDEAFEAVAKSPGISATEWTPEKPLQRGRMYSWQVRAVKDGSDLLAPRPPAPQAKFRILDSAIANEIDAARRAYPKSHLLLAVLSARAGLLEESKRELELLKKENPGSADVQILLDHLASPTSTKPAQ